MYTHPQQKKRLTVSPSPSFPSFSFRFPLPHCRMKRRAKTPVSVPVSVDTLVADIEPTSPPPARKRTRRTTAAERDAHNVASGQCDNRNDMQEPVPEDIFVAEHSVDAEPAALPQGRREETDVGVVVVVEEATVVDAAAKKDPKWDAVELDDADDLGDVYKLKDDVDMIKTKEGFLFNPFNPHNIVIQEADVAAILAKYGLPPVVHNLQLYQRAFVHRSYIKRPRLQNIRANIQIVERPPDCMPLRSKSNERLEFLGDGVLELVTKFLLYRRFPKANEGFMTRTKIANVRNKAIGKIALDMGLHRWFIISRHAEDKHTRTGLVCLGGLFEAFLGAVFLNFNKGTHKSAFAAAAGDEEDDPRWHEADRFITGPGFQYAQLFIENIYRQHVDWTKLILEDNNHKNKLQTILQKAFKVTPNYLILGESAEEGYTMGVFLYMERCPDSGKVLFKNTHLRIEDAVDVSAFGSFDQMMEVFRTQRRLFVFLDLATHKNKQEAEQLACKAAIDKLQPIYHTFPLDCTQ